MKGRCFRFDKGAFLKDDENHHSVLEIWSRSSLRERATLGGHWPFERAEG